MGDAKAIALKARPYQAAHLCFETDGIIEYCLADLGSPIKAFDLPAFHAELGALPGWKPADAPRDISRLKYEFFDIEAKLKPSSLATLRKEYSKSRLFQLMNTRSTAFWSKYAHIPEIVSKADQFYLASNAKSKPARLDNLARWAQLQADQLTATYGAELPSPRTGVVKTTETRTSSTDSSFGAATGNYEKAEFTDYGYRVPHIENQAQNERAQISLMDEQFGQFMSSLNLPFLTNVLLNEANTLDNEVFKAQIAHIGYFLLSPIDGIVTGKYKNPGEAVRAGETIYRVEDNRKILIEASVVYPDMIGLRSAVTITTKLFGAGPSVTLPGEVVTGRVHATEDRWELVIKCENTDSTGALLTPPGYRFDYDDTTVSIGPGPRST